MQGKSKLLALAFGTAVGLGVGTGALAIAARGPFAPPPPADEPPLSAAQREARWKRERAEAFDALCVRVDALPAQRPFDRSAMRPEPPIAATEELALLLRELQAAEALFRRDMSWQCWNHSRELAERLALFPWRFGKDPREVDGWAPIAAAANRLLADAEATPPALAFHLEDSYAALFRAQLLDLAGRRAEADKALADVRVQAWCGNCAAERTGVVKSRRAEAAEAHGDPVQALSLLDDCVSSFFDSHRLNIGNDIMLARYGLLMLQGGREAEGRCVLQLVAELRPGTPGAEVARAALLQMGALREPTLERLSLIWIDGAEERDPYRTAAVCAIASLQIPDAFERLAARRKAGDKAALAGLIALHDERTRPILESELYEGDLGAAQAAFSGLHALDGTAESYLRPFLERLAAPRGAPGLLDIGALDESLRAFCGDGPVLGRDEQFKDAPFAQAWLAWLAEQGR